MDMATKRGLGPSLLHVAGAMLVTGLGALASGYLLRDGAIGAFYGAGIASVWFLAREIAQIEPHWGWKTWRLRASVEERQRLIRQAGWPALVAHAQAAAILLIRYV
jgi:hypothetical protein